MKKILCVFSAMLILFSIAEISVSAGSLTVKNSKNSEQALKGLNFFVKI